MIEDRFPFSIDTGLSNPYDVELGELETPIGMIEVDAKFSFDIPHRSVCVAVTLGAGQKFARGRDLGGPSKSCLPHRRERCSLPPGKGKGNGSTEWGIAHGRLKELPCPCDWPRGTVRLRHRKHPDTRRVDPY